jgi:hypothetical protein
MRRQAGAKTKILPIEENPSKFMRSIHIRDLHLKQKLNIELFDQLDNGK